MRRLDAETVLAAAAQWVWVPDEAVTTETDDFLLVAYPSYYRQAAVRRWCAAPSSSTPARAGAAR